MNFDTCTCVLIRKVGMIHYIFIKSFYMESHMRYFMTMNSDGHWWENVTLILITSDCPVTNTHIKIYVC